MEHVLAHRLYELLEFPEPSHQLLLIAKVLIDFLLETNLRNRLCAAQMGRHEMTPLLAVYVDDVVTGDQSALRLHHKAKAGMQEVGSATHDELKAVKMLLEMANPHALLSAYKVMDVAIERALANDQRTAEPLPTNEALAVTPVVVAPLVSHKIEDLMDAIRPLISVTPLLATSSRSKRRWRQKPQTHFQHLPITMLSKGEGTCSWRTGISTMHPHPACRTATRMMPCRLRNPAMRAHCL